jgi:NAD(P)-dependent dehydrogenase (short-subunit alcohol dehydrogenase family)
VILTDLPFLQTEALSVIQSLEYPEKALFVPASVTEWKEFVEVFKAGKKMFGRIDIVVANAGIMESRPVLDVEVDENGDPVESHEATKVIDVNLKGALNSKYCHSRLCLVVAVLTLQKL